MENKAQYGLFEATGIELEYMVVDRKTLAVLPIVDKIFAEKSGPGASQFANREITWSNELVSHVIELKTSGPARTLNGVSASLALNVRELNSQLAKHEAMLLSTAAHPFMNPATDTVLWPHENREIYGLYDKIFDCRGHGWSNLQSTHLNLPFKDDREFRKLHAAIRVLLPLIPALCASSPILDGEPTGYLDSRMREYLGNQKKIPFLTGSLIPEPFYTREEYENGVLAPIAKAILPYDSQGILEPVFLNSRGAIARFDRWAIEIRVMDIQECPAADVAIAGAFRKFLKLLIAEKWRPIDRLTKFSEQELLEIFKDTIRDGTDAVVTNRDFLDAFGLIEKRLNVQDILWKLFEDIKDSLNKDSIRIIDTILRHGSLAKRIIARLRPNFSRGDILEIYQELSRALHENRLFL